MATEIFIVDLKKIDTVTRESWGNRYLIQAENIATAASAVDIISIAEQAVHFDRVSIDSARVATLAAGDGVYLSIPIDSSGSGITTGKTMPLFCTYQPKFQTTGFGPPGRKHYHTGFDDVSYDADFSFDNTVATGWSTALQTMLDDLVSNTTPMVNPQGAVYSLVTGGGFVTFHQFTKASKRTPA